MEKQYNALDKLSWCWRNESNNLTLNRYEIDSLFHYIRDLKDENTQLKKDLNGVNTVLNYLDKHPELNKDNIENLQDSDLYKEETSRAIEIAIETVLFDEGTIENAKERILEDAEYTKEILNKSQRTYNYIKNLDPNKISIKRLDTLYQKKNI